MTRLYDLSTLRTCGEDVIVHADVEIKWPAQVVIGKHVAIDRGFYCTTALALGDYIHIGPHCSVIGGSKVTFSMGHFSGLAAGVRIVCTSDEYGGHGLVGPVIPAEQRDRVISAPVTLEAMATVGTNSVLLPGVTVAEGTVISACSLVAQSTLPWMIYAGIPARPVRERPRERMLAAARSLGYQ